jgi:hypothetical protein
VTSVAISPEGNVLATGSLDATVRLWNVRDGVFLGVLKGHEGTVNSVAFHPGGELLGTGSWDGSIRIWDVQTQSLIRTMNSQSRKISCFAFDPTGRVIAAGGLDGSITFWSLVDGQIMATFMALDANEWLAYTPDGYFVGSDRSVHRLMMKFNYAGRAYPATFFPRQNPNPAKVAASLSSDNTKEPANTHQSGVSPKQTHRRPSKIVGNRFARSLTLCFADTLRSFSHSRRNNAIQYADTF